MSNIYRKRERKGETANKKKQRKKSRFAGKTFALKMRASSKWASKRMKNNNIEFIFIVVFKMLTEEKPFWFIWTEGAKERMSARARVPVPILSTGDKINGENLKDWGDAIKNLRLFSGALCGMCFVQELQSNFHFFLIHRVERKKWTKKRQRWWWWWHRRWLRWWQSSGRNDITFCRNVANHLRIQN